MMLLDSGLLFWGATLYASRAYCVE